jgi:U3 small nucleolar RNA-associated protein 14
MKCSSPVFLRKTCICLYCCIAVFVVPLPRSFHFAVYLQERAMKKHEEATHEEAQQALKKYDESLRNLEDSNSDQNEDSIKVTGKRTFGPVKNTQTFGHTEVNKRQKLEDSDKNSDSEYDSAGPTFGQQ